MAKTDWHLLESFRVAGRLQHVTRAAEQLGTSQPSLSRALARLQALVDAAAAVQPERRPTRPTRGSQRRRVDSKVKRGQIKAGRKPVRE